MKLVGPLHSAGFGMQACSLGGGGIMACWSGSSTPGGLPWHPLPLR